MSITITNNYGPVQNVEQGNGTQHATVIVENPQAPNSIIYEFNNLIKTNKEVSQNLSQEQQQKIAGVLNELDSEAAKDSTATKKKGAGVWLDRIKKIFTATGAILASPCWTAIKDLVTGFINKLH